MWTEPKEMPFNMADVLNALGNYRTAEVDYRTCWKNGKHAYHYVAIGAVNFQDKGMYGEKNAYSFAQQVQKLFAGMEDELRKQNIVFVRKKIYLSNGIDYVWRSVKEDELNCVDKIVRITPCDEFIDLRNWLKQYAGYELQLTDLYTFDICQKRSSKSYSNYSYTAVNPIVCRNILASLKAHYKKGNKITIDFNIVENMEDFERDRYEYEQYGYGRREMVVKITTATGRNPQCIRY